jgi:3-deoxy-D-manno-octulosonic-acid transferase
MLLYNLLSAIALLLYTPLILLKKGPEDRGRFIRERLGISRYEKTDIWVHAVSVGEVIASVPFLKALKKEFPGKRIVLSTTTYTGQKVAGERFPEADRIMYIPWDTGLCVNNAVSSLNPEIFITIETELWPLLFWTLKRFGAKVIILNGRISNKSFAGYRRLGFFMKKVLSSVDFFYMQGKSDAERVIEIGADRNKVGVMGNFKFDISLDQSGRLDWLEDIRGRILLGASTHRGEEEIILDAFKPLKQDHPDLKLILAPRHPERFHEVEEILKQRGSNFIRRSALTAGARHAVPLQKSYDVILLDTIGELSRVFSKVAVAFIGGSLVPLGGHNILEPAYWAKPVIFGPYMDNFPFAEEFLEQEAAIRVRDAREIGMTVRDLLDKSEIARQMGQRAKAMVEKNTGAVHKAIELVRGHLGSA